MADTSLSSLTRSHAPTSGTWMTKVPVIIAFFWLTKVATTAMGETTSDALNGLPTGPALAIPLMLVGLVWALRRQFRTDRYEAWTYWTVVVMVAIFGTSAADALHVGLGVPYLVSTIFYAVVLAVGLLRLVPGRGHALDPLDPHQAPRGLLLGDGPRHLRPRHRLRRHDRDHPPHRLPRLRLHVPRPDPIPFVAHRWLGLNDVVAFWAAYVLTRPLGASFADWMAVEPHRGGLGLGAGGASLILAAVVFLCIRRLATTKIDVLVEDVDLEAEGSGSDRPQPRRSSRPRP